MEQSILQSQEEVPLILSYGAMVPPLKIFQALELEITV